MAEPARRGLAGYMLGFAFGGFFDGILLHQVLQWHHLLSRIERIDPRMQVAADGYFHVLMYLIAAAGLWLAWRRRGSARDGAMLADFLLGFAIWHVADVVLFHWVLGLHNIRVDVADPLVWDVGWMVVFSAPAFIAAAVIRKRALKLRGMSAAIVVAVLSAGAFALSPVGKPAFATALFAPGVSPAAAMEAVADAGGTIAWMDASGQVLVFEASEVRRPYLLFTRGAIFVSGGALPAGCFDWTS